MQDREGIRRCGWLHWRSTYFLHYLLLKSTGYQPPQLRQTVIDPVSTALLNDLQKAGKTKEDTSITAAHPKVKKGGSFG